MICSCILRAGTEESTRGTWLGSGMGIRALLESRRTRMWGWLHEGQGHTHTQEEGVQQHTLPPRNHIWCARTGGQGCGGAARDEAGRREEGRARTCRTKWKDKRRTLRAICIKAPETSAVWDGSWREVLLTDGGLPATKALPYQPRSWRLAELSQNIHRVDLPFRKMAGAALGRQLLVLSDNETESGPREKGSKGMDSVEEKRGLMSWQVSLFTTAQP